MATIIRQRRDTEANWIANNPLIPDGQLCFDITNNTFRMGNGVDNYLDLVVLNEAGEASSSFTFQCGEDIPIYSVCVVISNELFLADSSDLSHMQLTKYLAKEAKLVGEICEVVEEGRVSQVGWGLSPNVVYFVGTDGAIQNTIPLGGYIQKAGVAETSDTLFFDCGTPIKL
jgi:uridine phosphorylase